MAALVPLLVPVVTSIVASLGLVFKEMRTARNRRNLREQAIAEASAEVSFAREWWQAHQLLGAEMTGSTETALEMLAVAQAKVTNTQHLSVREGNPVTPGRLLLLRPLRTRSAKALRLLFWLSASFVFIGFLVPVVEAAEGKGESELGGAISALTFFAVVTLVLRTSAVAADRPDSKRAQDDPEAAAPSDQPALASVKDIAS